MCIYMYACVYMYMYIYKHFENSVSTGYCAGFRFFKILCNRGHRHLNKKTQWNHNYFNRAIQRHSGS